MRSFVFGSSISCFRGNFVEMKLRMGSRFSTLSNDQNSLKGPETRTKVAPSTNGNRKAHSELNGSKPESKIKLKVPKENIKKITKYMKDNSFSEGNVTLKEFHIKLSRCDGDIKSCNGSGMVGDVKSRSKAAKGTPKKNSTESAKEILHVVENGKVEDAEMCDSSDVVASNSGSLSGEVKSKSLRRGKSSKENPTESDKEINKLLNGVENGKVEDSDICDSSDVVASNSGTLSEVKSKSMARGKRSKKNPTESDKEINNVPKEIESVQSENNLPEDYVMKECQINLERCDATEKNLQISQSPELSTDVDKKVKSVPNKTGKRKRGKQDEGESDEVKPSKSAKKEKESDKSKSSEEKIPDITSIDFSNDSKSSVGNKWNLKISSWNVNGIRAWLVKNGLSYLHHEKPDVICMQETKCSDDKLPEEMKKIEGYHAYWLSGDKDGYSGVGLLSKQEPIKVEYGIGISEHDNEGRVITAEYEKFHLVGAYVPNAGRKLVRLDYRMKWDEDFRAYLKNLDAKKPVILCGDLNVAHEEIDLANPKTNKKNAGFTKEERDGFSSLLNEGFTDTFRHLYPDVKGAYTFWTYMMNARAKNVGWRLDYFVISERLKENLCDCVIRKDVFGSDHCPITLFLAV